MKVINLGLIDYNKALNLQEELVDKLRIYAYQEQLIFCSHNPIVTLGKKTLLEDLGDWKGETFKVARGGSATYHGPSQVICYPIIRMRMRNNDIYKYVRALEQSMVEVLASYSVESHGDENSTGVWVGVRKIASIGIAIRRGITFHGLALNLYQDPSAFIGINPCGMQTDTMVSLEEVLGKKITRENFEKKLERSLLKNLSSENFIQH